MWLPKRLGRVNTILLYRNEDYKNGLALLLSFNCKNNISSFNSLLNLLASISSVTSLGESTTAYSIFIVVSRPNIKHHA